MRQAGRGEHEYVMSQGQPHVVNRKRGPRYRRLFPSKTNLCVSVPQWFNAFTLTQLDTFSHRSL